MLRLNIKNYRCFEDVSFDFSKVNILIGENSSGKSSLLKFLLLLKNSIKNTDKTGMVFNYIAQNYDLGSFRNMIYFNKIEKVFSFKFNLPYSDYIPYYKSFFATSYKKFKNELDEAISIFEGKPIELEFTFRILSDKEDFEQIIRIPGIGGLTIKRLEQTEPTTPFNPCVCNIQYIINGEVDRIERIPCIETGFLSLIDTNYLTQITNSDASLDVNLPKSKLFYQMSFFLVIQNYIYAFLDEISYINPLNSHPTRRIDLNLLKNKSISNNLDGIVNYFCKNHNNPNSLEQILLNRFQAFLINSGIVSGIQIKFNEEYGVAELHAKVDDKMSNIVDIGYGISLLLPILFEAFMNFTQKNILIEQPEIHIHPKLQCDLISALISVLGNNRIIIETHSPFIIQKLQVMVKNSDFGLKSDDVKIYYFKRGTLGSSISEHVINENGLLQPVFPKGFYDISYDLTRQLM